jgi:hypothetical protein
MLLSEVSSATPSCVADHKEGMQVPLPEDLPPEVREFIVLPVAEAIERHRDRIEWQLHTQEGQREADREFRIAETELAITLGSRAQETAWHLQQRLKPPRRSNVSTLHFKKKRSLWADTTGKGACKYRH